MPSDSDSFTRNTRPHYSPLVGGKGARVWDAHGQTYIDLCSQTLNAVLGQCHEGVNAAVVNQIGKLTCASSRFASDVSVSLHRKLIEITPAPLSKINLSSVTGSMANECAIKAVRKQTGRQVIVSRDSSHFGQSIETMRISGKHWDTKYLGDRNARFFEAPYCYRCPFQLSPERCNTECLDSLEDWVASHQEDICGVIMEPIMVDAGVLCPPLKYHTRVRQICSSHEIALIWDEIQTAFGWLGQMFAMDLFGVVPDILTLGKGLAAGFPLSAMVCREEYDVLDYGEHETTAGASPISCAAALAVIQHVQTTDLLEQVRQKGLLLEVWLHELKSKYSCVGDVRGVGLLWGIEIVDRHTGNPDKAATNLVFTELVTRGVITRICKVGENSNVLQIKPPLVITIDELEQGVRTLSAVIGDIGR